VHLRAEITMKTAPYHILVALAGGPLHGAEIRRRVDEQSGGSVTLYPAMLYGSLDDMVQAGWIQETPGEVDRDQPRWRFYGITTAGTRVLEEETARLEALLALARSNLEGAT
jgi:PadR family transcriptional regulator PadR